LQINWGVRLSVGLAEGDSMRPKERRDSGQNDFFKARLDQIIDPSCHRNLALVERESEGLARVQAALAARQF
jgi:hypothetical protein